MSDVKKFRIVNKSKQGASIDIKGCIGVIRVTWDDFKKKYEIVEDVWAQPNEECINELKDIETSINKAAVVYLDRKKERNNDRKQELLIKVRNLVDHIKSLTGLEEEQAVNLVQLRVNYIYEIRHKKYLENQEKFRKKREEQEAKSKTTLGDIFNLTKKEEK